MFETINVLEFAVLILPWKRMLNGGCFMRAGWVHDLKIYPYSVVDENRFVIMGKVSSSLKQSYTN